MKNRPALPIKIIAANNIAIPLFIFLLAFALRFSLIGKGYYHSDCLFLGMQAQKILDTHRMHYLHLTGYPLTALLGALFLGIGHLLKIENPALSINFMSVLLSSLSLALFYVIVKNLFDRITALLSTGLLTVHPVLMATSVFGNSHMPSLFFFLISLYCLTKHGHGGKGIYVWAGAVSFGLMAASRPQDIILLIPLGYLMLFGSPDATGRSLGEKTRPFFCFLLVSAPVLSAFYLPLLAAILSGGQAAASSQNIQAVIREVLHDLDLYALQVSADYVLTSFTLPGAAALLAGSVLVYIKSPRLLALLGLWALPPLLSFGSLVSVIPRLYINVVVPFSILAGYALSSLTRRRGRLFPAVSGLIYSLLIFLLFSGIYPIVHFRHNYDLLSNYGELITKNTAPNAAIICQDESTVVAYYSGRMTMKPPFIKYSSSVYTGEDEKRLADYKAGLEAKLKAGIPVYATSVALKAYDPGNKFLKLLENEFSFHEVGNTVMEEWHQGSTRLILFKERLYKIELKQPSASFPL